MGCYLEDYKVRIGTWAGKISWYGVPRRGVPSRGVPSRGVPSRGVPSRGVPRRDNDKGTSGDCLGLTVLNSIILFYETEQNSGPAVEVKNTVRLLCAACGRNLRSRN